MNDFQLKPALIVNIAGTLIEAGDEYELPTLPKKVKLLPNVFGKLNYYSEEGYVIIGVANYPQVAFDETSMEDGSEVMKTLGNMLNGKIHMVLGCFFHENGKNPVFGRRSLLRKPNYGMLALAESLCFNVGTLIDWDSSLMVGSSDEDRFCAESAQIPYYNAKEFFNWE